MAKRKGYRKEPTEYILNFEAPEFNGLEIRARSVSLRELFELQELQEKSATDVTSAREVIMKMASVITGWNIEDDDGNPIPATYDALAEYEMAFVMAIFNAWMQSMSTVPKPQDGNSSGTATSLELSLPMDA